MQHDYVIHACAQLIGWEVRERCLFAVAMWRRAREDSHFAARLDLDGGALPAAGGSCGRGSERTDFTVRRNANSHEPALRLGVTLCVSQLVVIHHIQRFLEGRSVVAAVVTEPGSGQ